MISLCTPSLPLPPPLFSSLSADVELPGEQLAGRGGSPSSARFFGEDQLPTTGAGD